MTKNIYTFSPQIAQFEVDPKNYTDAKEKTFRGGCGVAFFVIDNNNKKKYVNKRTLRKLSSRPVDFDTKFLFKKSRLLLCIVTRQLFHLLDMQLMKKDMEIYILNTWKMDPLTNI